MLRSLAALLSYPTTSMLCLLQRVFYWSPGSGEWQSVSPAARRYSLSPHNRWSRREYLRILPGTSIVVQVRVLNFPSRRNQSVSFLAQPLDDARLPERIRLSWFEPPVLPRLGETWKLELRLQRPRGNRNPGGFDFEAWLFREHVAATGYVVNSWRNRFISEGQLDVTQRVRERFAQRVTQPYSARPNKLQCCSRSLLVPVT